jgi:hypothetical protein
VWKLVVTLAVVVTATTANAENVKRVQYNGVGMTVNWPSDDSIEIAYPEQLPPELKDQGVVEGGTLLQGKWNRNLEVLEATAYAYFPGCQPRPYPVRGVVDSRGALVTLAPTPVDCTSELLWGPGAVMRFVPMVPVAEATPDKRKRRERVAERTTQRSERRTERKVERRRRETPIARAPRYQYPSYGYPQQYWQW